MRYLKKPKHMAIWKVVILDILLVGVILVVFAFFHHVLPAIISNYEREQAQLEQRVTEPTETQTQPTETEPVQTEEPTEAETTEPPTEPDNRTEWQKKFEEHFTDEVVITDTSYTSPNVSITVETVTTELRGKPVTYHVADIYVASMENFKTYTANGEMRYFGTQDLESMVADSGAIVAISGDFLTYQKSGFLMRNGVSYVEDHSRYSACVLFEDGTMETYYGKDYEVEDLKARGAVQVWSFGPVLLDENGEVRENYDEVPQAVAYSNPRSAIGYYEPGHYCFVVVDGRQAGYSDGMLMSELAAVFQQLGCNAAYNLDGGGTAVMAFQGQAYSRQSNGGRDLGDILLITESSPETAVEETTENEIQEATE